MGVLNTRYQAITKAFDQLESFEPKKIVGQPLCID